ncbi:LacI family DNA-binding transcriptional regulator [Rosettibacter firmus]|uniref:LacI family DNA-binding transcriptional regulator n=1 Tax=Rosettibacter firmus TaxID=3111522 RepID=UPI00336BB552
MKSKPVTLSDIAKILNVSTVTVSKALRNHPDISPETTKKIKKLAEELEYTPNLIARSLSARRSNTIGVIVPKIAHFFFSSIIENIYKIGLENNYEIILAVSQEDAELERKHIHTLLAMKVDGIIVSITQQTTNYDIFETVIKRGIPIVFIDRVPYLSNISTVTVDDRGGAFKAVEHAIKMGYKKIAHFAGYTNINIGKERLQGFKDAMEKYGLEINPDWVIEGGFGEDYGYNAFMKLYRENNLPEFILTVTFPVALGVYKAVKELGLRIPEDIDLICFGNSNIQEFLCPPLSCIDQSTTLLSQNAMEILFENIQKQEEFEPRNITIETNLVLRGTCTRKHT